MDGRDEKTDYRAVAQNQSTDASADPELKYKPAAELPLSTLRTAPVPLIWLLKKAKQPQTHTTLINEATATSNVINMIDTSKRKEKEQRDKKGHYCVLKFCSKDKTKTITFK